MIYTTNSWPARSSLFDQENLPNTLKPVPLTPPTAQLVPSQLQPGQGAAGGHVVLSRQLTGGAPSDTPVSITLMSPSYYEPPITKKILLTD